MIFYGKPHRPIYERAMVLATERRGQAVPLKRVLAIGDSVRTDLAGATAFGLDCVFVTSRLHAEHYGSREAPDLDALNAIFTAAGVNPRAAMRGLAW